MCSLYAIEQENTWYRSDIDVIVCVHVDRTVNFELYLQQQVRKNTFLKWKKGDWKWTSWADLMIWECGTAWNNNGSQEARIPAKYVSAEQPHGM